MNLSDKIPKRISHLVLIIGLVFLLGEALWQYNLAQRTHQKNNVSQENNLSQSKWRLYRSKKMRFMVRYPPSWESAKSETKVENGRSWFIRSDLSDNISINFIYGKYRRRFDNGKQGSREKILSYSEIIAERLKEISQDPQFEVTNINLGGRQGKEFRFNPHAARMITEPKDLINYEIYIPFEGNNVFTIAIIANKDYLEDKAHQRTLENILSSLAFIPSSDKANP